MSMLSLAGVLLGLAGFAPASAQEDQVAFLDRERTLPAPFDFTVESPSDEAEDVDGEDSLPMMSLQDKDKDNQDKPRQHERVGFAIGPAGGFMKARGADRGTWFAGVAARFYFARFLAVEGAITFHENEYNDGDTHVTQYPVQVSLLFFPFPSWDFQPYLLGGAGWYYTRIDNSGSLQAINDETEHWFGGHLGFGAEVAASRTFSLFVDFRYIFIDPKTDIQNESGNADYWQVTFGLGFGF